MKTKVALLVALLLAGSLWTSSTAVADAPDPAAVARRCVHAINQQAHTGARHIGRICRHTLGEIREAIANEDREAARAAAERGIMLACRVEHAAHNQIRMTVEHCLRVLNRLEADPELARIVVHAGQRGSRFVSAVKDRCLAAIADAVGHDG